MIITKNIEKYKFFIKIKFKNKLINKRKNNNIFCIDKKFIMKYIIIFYNYNYINYLFNN